jgi:hypothetical protein
MYVCMCVCLRKQVYTFISALISTGASTVAFICSLTVIVLPILDIVYNKYVQCNDKCVSIFVCMYVSMALISTGASTVAFICPLTVIVVPILDIVYNKYIQGIYLYLYVCMYVCLRKHVYTYISALISTGASTVAFICSLTAIVVPILDIVYNRYVQDDHMITCIL